MIMKNKFSISLLVTTAIVLVLAISCVKDINDSPVRSLNNRTTALFNPNLEYGSLTDIDGNIYKTITIGTQTWMAENLRTTKYRNGDPIPHVTNTSDWAELTTGAYCNFNNIDQLDTVATLGRLYNWHVISNSRTIAPNGWHIPTESDWNTLVTYLGGKDDAGGKMKEVGTLHWLDPNTGATNESGFTGFSSGWRGGNGIFYNSYGNSSFWWTTTGYNEELAFGLLLRKNNTTTALAANEIRYGGGVRCVKD